MADILRYMLLNAPDPNEPLPVSNRKETIYGAVLPFFIVAWVAIGLRMWVRFRIMREPGWDDFFVVMAGCLNTIAVGFLLDCRYRKQEVRAVVNSHAAINYGFGHHYLYIGAANMVKYQRVCLHYLYCFSSTTDKR
jgi:hypothetical protein